VSFILGLLLFVIVGGAIDARLPWRDTAPRRR
jgi:hypothetical protein